MSADTPDWPDVSRLIWESRYRLAGEHDIHDSWRRIARAVAAAEGNAASLWETRFFELMRDFRFIPGGRILAAAGSRSGATLCNCFVMGAPVEDPDGLRGALHEGLQTLQAGGGVGYDFSTLQPRGESLAHGRGRAAGAIVLMTLWDAACDTLVTDRARRGAMMASLRCDHPDIEAFLDAKRVAGALEHFNLSVQVTDDFMTAVSDAAPWPLRFPASGPSSRVRRMVPARELWERLLQAAWDTAEPGVLFIDTVNRENNLYYREHLTTTNPCGEIPLPPYGACHLGSLNLTAFVIEPFEPGARLDLARIEQYARLAVRFLDDVIDVGTFPLAMQADAARQSRRIGLGVTGLADMLAMLGHRYDSWTARGVVEEVIRRICLAAYDASVDLARERGAFPCLVKDAYLNGQFIARLPGVLRDRIARIGIRNSHLLAIAPAGSISLLAGNLSGGIEPILASHGTRRIMARDGTAHEHPVTDFAWALWEQSYRGTAAPAALAEAHEVTPADQVAMQAVAQPWIDNAISKTINVPPQTSFDSFREIFRSAHASGLKGCTVFRRGTVRGAVVTPRDAIDSACCSPGMHHPE